MSSTSAALFAACGDAAHGLQPAGGDLVVARSGDGEVVGDEAGEGGQHGDGVDVLVGLGQAGPGVVVS